MLVRGPSETVCLTTNLSPFADGLGERSVQDLHWGYLRFLVLVGLVLEWCSGQTVPFPFTQVVFFVLSIFSYRIINF